MNTEHFFVTGAMGCIGAWVLRNLVQEGAQVTAFDLSNDRRRLELVLSAEELAQISFVQGDITDTAVATTAVAQSRANHIIHLAALQVPFCKANPALGAAVNVVGTVNMFEAAKQAGIGQIMYTSSVAVYGRQEMYATPLLSHDAPLHPLNHYGVYKQANEGSARIYWQDDGIASVGLRPYTVYGPGRDQGLTSEPTKAMLAAARGEPYHIGFGGINGFQYVDDIARLCILAARTPAQGAHCFNIQGSVAHMREVVAAIETAVPTAAGHITYADAPLPFPNGQEDMALCAFFGAIPNTSLTDGVAATISHFQAALQDGRLPQNQP